MDILNFKLYTYIFHSQHMPNCVIDLIINLINIWLADTIYLINDMIMQEWLYKPMCIHYFSI